MANERPRERTNNNTTRADFQSVGEHGRGDTLAPSSVDDTPRPDAPSPIPAPFPISVEPTSKRSSFAKVAHLESVVSPSVKVLWANGDADTSSTEDQMPISVDEEFPPSSQSVLINDYLIRHPN